MARVWLLSQVITVVLASAVVLASTGLAAGATPVPACDQGRTLERLGRYPDAAAAYLKGLTAPASAKCAKAALERLARHGRLCSAAQSLEDLDRDADANAAYRKVLAVVPGSECAQTGARRTNGKDVLSWSAAAATDVGSVLAALTLGGLALTLAGWALVVLGTRIPGLKRFPPFRGFRRVRVQVKDLGDTALGPGKTYGAATTGLLRARLTTDAADARVDQASGTAVASEALDGLGDVSPQAKIIVALINMLKAFLPKRDWVVTGELQAPGEHGEGLSLAIDNAGSFVDFGAFWRRGYTGPGTPIDLDAFRQLSVPAAGWLAHHVASVNRPRDLLSTDARSWALTQYAMYWYDLDERETARSYYQEALGADSHNVVALVNLAVMNAEDGLVDGPINQLAAALAILEGQQIS